MTPINEREIGELQMRLQSLEHRARNDRQVTVLLETEIDELRSELDRFRVRVYATVSTAAAFAGMVAWALEHLSV